ncbi:hypothetical protein H1R20_g5160, partial [Candolleomyces eurysporus]
MASTQPKPYLREAKFPQDFDEILEVSRRAFQTDPPFLFCSNVKEVPETGLLKEEDNKRLVIFLAFFLRCCVDIKARITVVVYPEEGGKERIAAAACWMPPKKRIASYQVGRLIRGGVTGLFKAWGPTGIHRMTTQYTDISHKSLQKVLKKRVDDTWYLNMVMTHPDYQGRGCLSMIVREQFKLVPEATYCLEASTPKSRNQYAHFGFEVHGAFTLGKGKVGADGLPAKGAAATGMEISPMIKRPPSSK